LIPTHVLVTGGAGFIGSHVVDRLRADGHRVTVLDDLSSGQRLNLQDHLGHPDFALVVADASAPLSLPLAPSVARFGPITHIVHLAAQVSVVRSLADPHLDLRVNVGATLQVLEYARLNAVRAVVFASSAAVYGDVDRVPVDESVPPSPLSPYGVHKLASELHLRAYGATYGLATTALRFFNVYGPRQDPQSPYSGVISIFLARAAAGAPLTVHGDGAQTRDMIYVGDVVEHIVRALARTDGRGEPINVGTGREVPVRTLAELAVRFANSNSDLVFGPPRLGDIQRSCANVARADAWLTVPARTDIAVGLARTAAWFASARASQLA